MKNLMRALSFLTVIPLPFVRFEQDGRDLSAAAVAFPLAGAIIGLVQAVLAWLLLLALPSGPTAVLLLAVGFLLTRGLHLDGLADTADGLIGVTDRAKSLKAMADSAIGVMGAAVVIFVLLLKFSLLRETGEAAQILILVAVFFMPRAGRWAIVIAGAFYKPALDRGLGDMFLRSLGWPHLLKASFFAILLLTVIFIFLPPLIIPVLTGVAAALLGGFILAAYTNRRLGGLTGDILGAASELGELIFLLVFYLFIRHGQLQDAFIKVVNSLATFL